MSTNKPEPEFIYEVMILVPRTVKVRAHSITEAVKIVGGSEVVTNIKNIRSEKYENLGKFPIGII